MEIYFNFSNVQKERIRDWKNSVPTKYRKFTYTFTETGKLDASEFKVYKLTITAPNTGFKVYKLTITAPNKNKLTLSEKATFAG